MAPASNEEQFKFLISCIRYSNNGKIDFDAVRTECDICSKGAAAKRYERMMKAHGIYQTSSTIADASIPPNKAKVSSVTATSDLAAPPSGKKRKHAQFVEANTNTDDDEGLSKVKSESSVRKIKGETVKEESGDLQARLDTVVVKQPALCPESFTSTKAEFPVTSATAFNNADDLATYNDFLSFGGFDGHDAESWGMVEANTSSEEQFVKNTVPESKGVVPASILATE